MNSRSLALAAAIVSVGVYAAPAAAVTSADVNNAVRSSISGSSGQIHSSVNGSTAVLFGYSDKIDSMKAERAALALPGIDTVRNRINDQSS